MVLRGAPSILRKRSILSKRQCEHCRSCCVYAVGLSVVVYAVPVASSHRGGFKYAAHTPAAVCGWRSEQNLAAVVPKSVSVHVCVCGFLSFFFAFFCISQTNLINNSNKNTKATTVSDTFPSFPFSSDFLAPWGPKVGGWVVRASSFCYFYNGFLSILKVHYAELTRSRRAPGAPLTLCLAARRQHTFHEK